MLHLLSSLLFPLELTDKALSYCPSENWALSFKTSMLPVSLCENYFSCEFFFKMKVDLFILKYYIERGTVNQSVIDNVLMVLAVKSMVN